MDLRDKTVRRNPFDHGVGIDEGAVNPFGRRRKHSVKLNRSWHFYSLRYSLAILAGWPVLYKTTGMIIQMLFALSVAFQVHATPSEISGQVSLAKGAALKPGGILFIFAKKAGIPMPAAVLRVPDPKLPYKFSIGAQNAMAPGTPFDGPFTITARYSPSGDAMDKSGPEGSAAKPVAVGTENLKIEMKAK
jgi:hypothetical protein